MERKVMAGIREEKVLRSRFIWYIAAIADGLK